MMKRKNRLFAVMTMAMMLGAGTLTGCGGTVQEAAGETVQETAGEVTMQDAAASVVPETGVLYVKVNPEVAVHYDDQGIVTAVEGVNSDGISLVQNAEQFIGRECREVVRDLVEDINEAGYFTEEIEGENRQIVIEVEKGSAIPDQEFLNEIVADVQGYVSTMQLTSDIDIEGATDYTATDYGPNADGATGYDDTDYGPNADGVTDYDDTDYGPNADGVTDYDDTDYGPNADGVTDYAEPAASTVATNYDDTDYGPNADGVTDYDDTDYGPNADGVTDYDDTDYGPNADGVTDYVEPAPAPSPVPAPSGDSSYGDTNYDDGGSDYDLEASDGDSNYDDGGSNYDDGGSDYDD